MIFFDFETTKAPCHLPWIPGSFPVSLHARKDGVVYRWILNHVQYPFRNHIPEIQAFFASDDTYVAQNAKFDLHWLRKLGVPFLNKNIYCTMVAEYIISGQTATGELSLDDLALKYGIETKKEGIKVWWDNDYDTHQVPLTTLIEYGDHDVFMLEEIYYHQVPIIIEQKQLKIVELRCDALKITQEIEWNGMKLDLPYIRKMSEDYTKTIDHMNMELARTIKETLKTPKEFVLNLNSPDQLSAVMFGGKLKYKALETYEIEVWDKEMEWYDQVLKDGSIKKKSRWKKVRVPKSKERMAEFEFETKGLGFTPAPRTETKKPGIYSTDASQMSQLKYQNETQKEVISTIREVNKLIHMRGTYFDGLLKREVGGYAHPKINETKTGTGRYSMTNPNLQNQPREGTSPVKESFITRF